MYSWGCASNNIFTDKGLGLGKNTIYSLGDTSMKIKLSTLAYLAFAFLALLLAHISSAYIKDRFFRQKQKPNVIAPHTILVEPILDNNPDKIIIYHDLKKALQKHYGNDSLAYFDLLKAYLKKNNIGYFETKVNEKGDTIIIDDKGDEWEQFNPK